MKENLNLIKRGIDELISEKELLAKLKSKSKYVLMPRRRVTMHLLFGRTGRSKNIVRSFRAKTTTISSGDARAKSSRLPISSWLLGKSSVLAKYAS